ncbi:unnamed protein product, partial [Prorocentrum cordatum]
DADLTSAERQVEERLDRFFGDGAAWEKVRGALGDLRLCLEAMGAARCRRFQVKVRLRVFPSGPVSWRLAAHPPDGGCKVSVRQLRGSEEDLWGRGSRKSVRGSLKRRVV